jgi:hypothetical protein
VSVSSDVLPSMVVADRVVIGVTAAPVSKEAKGKEEGEKGKEKGEKGKEQQEKGKEGLEKGKEESAKGFPPKEAPFDSKLWLNAFRQAKRDGDEGRVSALRRVVQEETDEVLKSKSYQKDGKTVVLPELAESVKHTLMYDGKSVFGSFSRSHQTTAHFVKADVVDVALFLMEKKNVNPVVLVLADEKRLGGALREGTCAQEEAVFRRSSLLLNLEDPDQVKRKEKKN